jgi:hypothetical protein
LGISFLSSFLYTKGFQFAMINTVFWYAVDTLQYEMACIRDVL